ncbi:SHIRT domain-containing protein [Olsenella sp. YH-ols2217]|uniref:SHIRT domain-containing protein n=1 Tax=Kribbibacterium absianum TaxID=3044210 RepID=A0ABT6ZJ67_9ACTN|nr:SHIRT domain-containing protein [Olsenella sp. YH-ols2217]MDJ1122652.1 SHIRT domain-containing protein [Olsenella sp. YH-ols2216]MDJ1129090.1 SHIRT domain-containing protein [Olsenella sp. YH-ols2217]
MPAQGAVVSASAEARPVRLVASLERVDGTAAVRPGDDVAFRVSVGSFLDGAGLEDSLDARLADADLAVSINGAPVQPDSLVAGEGPGVYTVSHRVSEQDAALGAVEAALDVRATYEGVLAVPNGAPLRSRAAVAASLVASAPLSSPHGVTYRFVWDAPTTDAAPVPQGLTAPRDRAVHWPGDTVAVMQPEVTSVALREGTWSFRGWTLDGEPVGASVPMRDEGLVFQGSWAFAPAPRHSVTYGFSGDAPAVAPPATVRAYAGDAVALPQLDPVPETRLTDRGVLKDGTWRFCGWTVDGDEPAATVSGDMALEGSWAWSVPARPAEAAVALAGHEGVYDGQGHSVAVDGLLSGDVASYASLRHVSGPVPARARVSTEPPSRCDAGATSVSVTVSNQGFADDAEATALLTVRPRPVRIAVDDATWVAGEPEPAYTGSVEMARWGSAEQRGLLDRAHLGRVSFRRVVDTTLPGVYEGAIGARYVENPNYDVEVLPGTLTIVAPAARPRGERV